VRDGYTLTIRFSHGFAASRAMIQIHTKRYSNFFVELRGSPSPSW
jgi:hypothetical protein